MAFRVRDDAAGFAKVPVLITIVRSTYVLVANAADATAVTAAPVEVWRALVVGVVVVTLDLHLPS
jgi:hypothetical protein